jgi:hemoglobin
VGGLQDRLRPVGSDVDALVEDLIGALDTFKVGAHEKDQLLGALGPMKADIVDKKSPQRPRS